MFADETAIERRHRRRGVGVRKEHQTSDTLNRFLKSGVGKGAKHTAAALTTDVLHFFLLAGLVRGEKTHKQLVHNVDCDAAGTDILTGACCRAKGSCEKRLAHDSLRTKYASKLAVAYERDLGAAPAAWCDQRRVGNPVRSEIVTQYDKAEIRAGVRAKQAPALPRSHLPVAASIAPIRARLQGTVHPGKRMTLARETPHCSRWRSVQRRKTDELTRTLYAAHSKASNPL